MQILQVHAMLAFSVTEVPQHQLSIQLLKVLMLQKLHQQQFLVLWEHSKQKNVQQSVTIVLSPHTVMKLA